MICSLQEDYVIPKSDDEDNYIDPTEEPPASKLFPKMNPFSSNSHTCGDLIWFKLFLETISLSSSLNA
jgi:hypothetical protein